MTAPSPVAALWPGLRTLAMPCRIADGGVTATVCAVPIYHITDVDVAPDGLPLQSSTLRDYILPASSLDQAGLPNPPTAQATLDQLDHTGQTIHTAAAHKPAGGRHYRYTDPWHTLIRLHTTER